MTKRILLECTPTFSTDMMTGIQRVVHNIVHHSSTQTLNDEIEVIPVIFKGKQLYSIAPDTLSHEINGINHTQKENNITTRLLFALNKNIIFSAFKDKLRGRLYPLLNFLKNIYISLLVGLKTKDSNAQVLKTRDEDTLVFIDVSWGRDFWNEISTLSNNNVNIVFVLYDLIHINFSHFYGKQIAEDFDYFVRNMLKHADQVLCISKAVKNDLLSYIESNQLLTHSDLPNIDYFHLGVDTHKNTDEESVRPSIKVQFNQGSSPIFLMLGTIEPRKNHLYLLDAFEALWKQGNTARLVIVGRIGQLAEAFMKRIESHPELNKNLFVFHDLDDAEVNFCYKQSTALIFPSFAEGFGLPVIEALQNQLPVIASDIPVHREIGKDKIMYIDPYDTASLISRIQQITETGIEEQYQPKDFHWMNWQESTDMFLKKVLNTHQKEAKP